MYNNNNNNTILKSSSSFAITYYDAHSITSVTIVIRFFAARCTYKNCIDDCTDISDAAK